LLKISKGNKRKKGATHDYARRKRLSDNELRLRQIDDDTNGRVSLAAAPSAVAGYDETKSDLVN
jgi:hypothetical protein